MTLKPGIGVATAIVRDGRLLLGRRIARYGNGLWQTPGGKLDPGETLAAAAVRETFEETGLAVTEPREIARQFDDFPEIGYRYETVFFGVRCDVGDPENREPDKCAGWSWLPLDELPNDRFAIDAATIDAIRAYAEDEAVSKAVAELLAAQSSLALGTSDERGRAYVSYVPFAWVAGTLVFAVSGLAAHARHLRTSDATSALVVGDPISDPYARIRLTLDGRARALTARSPEAESAWDALQARHGNTPAILRALPDFIAYAFEPEHARLILGFASAHTVAPICLARLAALVPPLRYGTETEAVPPSRA